MKIAKEVKALRSAINRIDDPRFRYEQPETADACRKALARLIRAIKASK